jgi:hypothetical protein
MRSVKTRGLIAVFIVSLEISGYRRQPMIRELLLEHKYENSAASVQKAALLPVFFGIQ